MRAIQIIALGLAAAISSPVCAQQARLYTQVADAEHESPEASLIDMEWLVGSWVGEGVRGAQASETWTKPIGDTMVGTFIQQNAEGGIMFTELMYITEVEGSLVLRLKHFNPDMTSWEEKNEVKSFRLIRFERCAAFFQGLTIRCASAVGSQDGLLVAVRAGTDDEGNVREIVFRYAPSP